MPTLLWLLGIKTLAGFLAMYITHFTPSDIWIIKDTVFRRHRVNYGMSPARIVDRNRIVSNCPPLFFFFAYANGLC